MRRARTKGKGWKQVTPEWRIVQTKDGPYFMLPPKPTKKDAAK